MLRILLSRELTEDEDKQFRVEATAGFKKMTSAFSRQTVFADEWVLPNAVCTLDAWIQNRPSADAQLEWQLRFIPKVLLDIDWKVIHQLQRSSAAYAYSRIVDFNPLAEKSTDAIERFLRDVRNDCLQQFKRDADLLQQLGFCMAPKKIAGEHFAWLVYKQILGEGPTDILDRMTKTSDQKASVAGAVKKQVADISAESRKARLEKIRVGTNKAAEAVVGSGWRGWIRHIPTGRRGNSEQ